MAKMIPQFGSAATDSRSEPVIYDLLEVGLSNEFTVIHSLPWLCAAAKELDGSFVPPTGEVDFLILHPQLGVLAIEVKGGRYKIEGAAFVLIHSGDRVEALRQTRRNTHGLAKWLAGKNDIRCRIGYALCFPDSHFRQDQLPPGLVDPSGPKLQTITLSFGDMPRLSDRIREVMEYWKAALSTPPLGKTRVKEIVDALCPSFNGSPEWAQRVAFDNHFWLRLTDEQSSVVNKVLATQRSIITGWPGTGKTLIGIEVVRRLKKGGARVVVLTYNAMLADYLAGQLNDQNCDVLTWHKLCAKARARIGLPPHGSDTDWYENKCSADLQSGIEAGLLEAYDVLILDEAQALRSEWCVLLATWFAGKRIVALCDETQVFSFEKGRTTLAVLSGILGNVTPFHLTIVMRMPRAVTDRLIEVLPSPVQLSSPRKFDAATVREMVVDDLETCLRVITDDLFSQGIQPLEIVVLCKYSRVPKTVDQFVLDHPGIRVCNVSRFRGMESPVIIVVSADEFSDQELFCAYSRATTVCNVLFSAHELLSPKEGGFLTAVVDRSDNRDVIETLRHRSHTRTLLASHPRKPIDAIRSISLAWSPQWMCWMVQCARISPMSLWVDYLVSNYSWPVLFWYEDSHSSAYLAEKNLSDESIAFTQVRIAHCSGCNQNAPLASAPDRCYVCDGILCADGEKLMLSQVTRLIGYDETIGAVIDLPPDELLQGIKKIPIVLGIATVAQRAVRLNPFEEIVRDTSRSSGTDLYRWACALTKSLILLRPESKEISLAEVAKETYHPDFEQLGVELSKWHQNVALAFNLHYKHEYLFKVGKGRYRIS
jgi:hypothetical protein